MTAQHIAAPERGPNMKTRDWIWSRILELDEHTGTFTMADLTESDVPYDTVHTYVQGLLRAGYLKEVKPTRSPFDYPRKHYRLLRRQRQAPAVRRDGSASMQRGGQQQLWNAMRKLRSFDWHELAAVASTPECPVAPGTAQRYVGLLQRAGYLAKVQPARAGRRARWRLKYDTGPRAPRVVRAVHDPNTGHIHFGADTFEE